MSVKLSLQALRALSPQGALGAQSRRALRVAALPLAAALTLTLSGCGNPFVDDLREFVENSGKTAPPTIPPLPPAQEFAPVAFTGADASDPFAPRRSARALNGGEAPDANRKKEFLETIALDAIRMNGYMTRGGRDYAMVTANGSMVMIQPGNHMGLNYGKVIKITPDGIGLVETVQDDRGAWIYKNAILPMSAPNQPEVKEGDIFKDGEGAAQESAAMGAGAASGAAKKTVPVIPPVPGPLTNQASPAGGPTASAPGAVGAGQGALGVNPSASLGPALAPSATPTGSSANLGPNLGSPSNAGTALRPDAAKPSPVSPGAFSAPNSAFRQAPQSPSSPTPSTGATGATTTSNGMTSTGDVPLAK